jgi:ribosomal protein L35
MKKSILKRITITKNGKIVRRPIAVNHSRTRKNSKAIRGKRKTRGLAIPMRSIVNY